ncbi:MAG: V-type ATP synthase subunit F [Gammaproteobacteria bacterium]|jgi:vacuolar-type H+-ATPase subunit F/Vma7
MSVAEFIGDEVTAAGYRLCGIDVQVVQGSNAMALIRQACERASLVLVSAGVAQHIRRADLDQLLVSIQPPVLVVPDVCAGQEDVPGIVARIHKQLGMLE